MANLIDPRRESLLVGSVHNKTLLVGSVEEGISACGIYTREESACGICQIAHRGEPDTLEPNLFDLEERDPFLSEAL